MKTLFSKYSGCGNDFILIDDREEFFPINSPGLIVKLCHRQKGIGADGVILLQQSSTADFRMRILNADGSEAEMCGNGIRCLMKFIQEMDLSPSTCTIESKHRTHRIALDKDLVFVEMGPPQDLKWDLEVPFSRGGAQAHFLNTGVPHAVEFVEDLQRMDLHERGSIVRHHPLFAPKGTNYNAAKLSADGSLSVRTFERGVEAETLACGTGATATALAAAWVYGLDSPIKVFTRSGEALTIGFNAKGGSFEEVWMGGPADKIYSGSVDFEVFKLKDTDFLG